jgi:hypothetical protein
VLSFEWGACERTIDLVIWRERVGSFVVSREAHLRRILTRVAAPVCISVYGQLIRRSLP